MITVALTNQKGGVGKTTTAHVLACGLHHKGYKVLMIDTDPQTNLTYTVGLLFNKEKPTLFEVLKDKIPVQEAIQTTDIGFDIIAGSLDLASADIDFNSNLSREYLLKDALEPICDRYDYCIIDTPPTLGILTINALTAADEIIVPMVADVYSFQGFSRLKNLVDDIKGHCNSNLYIKGLLLTKYNQRAVINRSLKENLENLAIELDTKLFSSYIREAVAVKEVQYLQEDIFTKYPKAKITKDYQSFVDEFLEE